MPFMLLAVIFGVLAWGAWHLSVRDANILYAALAFILAAISMFFFFGAFLQ